LYIKTDNHFVVLTAFLCQEWPDY